MRQIVLLFLILSGCALRGPSVPKESLPWPGTVLFRTSARYELRFPGRCLKGRVYLLGDPLKCIYFEAPSPWGLTILQGVWKGKDLRVVYFPQRASYQFLFRLPGDLSQALPYLLIRALPPFWQPWVYRAEKRNNSLWAYFHHQDLEGRLVWKAGRLQQIVIWQGTTRLLVVEYPEKTQDFLVLIKVPSLRLSLRLDFDYFQPYSQATNYCSLQSPEGFKSYSYEVDYKKAKRAFVILHIR